MTTDTKPDKFLPLQAALTTLAAAGVSVKFAEIYYCGEKMTAVIMTNVRIDDHGRLAMMDLNAKITPV